jgi:predicted dehydrogenase
MQNAPYAKHDDAKIGPEQSRLVSRRNLLASAAGGSGALLIPSQVLGQSPKTAPSEKLNIAFVGIGGGYGTRALNELSSQNIVAVCDVDWRTREQQHVRFKPAIEEAALYPKARRFNDWRKMLEEMDKGIDGIVVCTPDHTHAVISITAMKMGKHVFCEKPLAHSVDEVRAMIAAGRKYKVATQTGVQGHASEDLRSMVEWVRDGAIGPVREVHLFEGARPPRHSNGAARAMHGSIYDAIAHVNDKIPVPPEVKWDLWLGPAHVRPYNPMYLPIRWRSWLDFGTGVLGDHGPHYLDPVVWALDLGFPEVIEAATDPEYNPEKNTQTFPRSAIVHYRFPANGDRPPVSLTWYQSQMPPRPRFLKPDDELPSGGGMLVGDRGAIVFGPIYNGKPGAIVPGLVKLYPEELDRSYKRPARTLSRPQSQWLEWIECAKTGKQASANFDYGGLITQIALLGDIAIRNRGALLRFDANEQRFTNCEGANKAFEYYSRPGWALPD